MSTNIGHKTSETKLSGLHVYYYAYRDVNEVYM